MRRKRPYTDVEISRKSCYRCQKPAQTQWKICSDGAWRPLCLICDVALNELILTWMGDLKKNAKIRIYKKRMWEILGENYDGVIKNPQKD